MKMAHLIMAYKYPWMIERMIGAMRHPGFVFYIHLDKKIDKEAFEYLAGLPNVFFIKNRTEVRWAAFSFSEAIWTSVEEILEAGNYDFINLMSGQDYPIKPAEMIYDYFSRHMGRNFLQCSPPDTSWVRETCHIWASRYHLVDYNFRGRHRVEGILNALLPSRSFPFPYTIYGGQGGAWWTLSTACAQYVVRYLRNNRKFRRYLKHTWGPDEFVPHTLIMNSAYKETTLLNRIWYQDWSSGGNHPKILQLEDLNALTNSDKLLARKFDDSVDHQVLAKIDSYILSIP